MTRVIEGMSVEETANLLNLPPDTVKTRLHRARKLVRKELDKQIGAGPSDNGSKSGFDISSVWPSISARKGLIPSSACTI
jgi:RNA polymerase sigma-70 factor, ECF subfamily